jgi:hypothetical protein
VKVIVCGSRHWDDWDTIRRELEALPAGSTVVVGSGAGAEVIAGALALHVGLQVRAFPADWDSDGSEAGAAQNQRMLEEERPDLVLVFHPNLEEGRATWDMFQRARLQGIEVRVIAG